MKATWSCDHRGGGRSKFMSTKKRPADYKEMNTLLTYAVAKALRFKNNSKAKAKEKSDLDNES